ncbi:NADPH-dependent FMN reductase [Mesorhizobium sp. BE184]|uniref:NADPH-dependent FMN reductase n=1 Tax=Mesorhizobium sp. BE184 TaxID=2817714 RepID=UPI0028576A5F|nr:NADPH-dependent FMN reductase [Mesorhizobium sp. BE184]MDR7033937.1 NAD(P)H-dependent FMN reductase [Mesorhizobium sp. BE184]
MPDFLAISGSLRAVSTNSALVRALARDAPNGLGVTIYGDLGLLPIFNPDEEQRLPNVVAALVEAVARADGVIVSCPEYAHGVPGGLKNALDWLVSHEAAVGKPAMLVHASQRSHFARAALAEIMRTMSFDLYDGLELEVPLLGKKPPEMEAVLAELEHRQAIRSALTRFADFVTTR